MIKKRISKLRDKFLDFGIDGYIVPKNDEFFSEYSQKDRLKTISNFNGSAGFAIILKRQNYLFVDDRYTIQAKIESGKEFKIINLSKILNCKLFKNLTLGLDTKIFTFKQINNFFLKYNKIKEIKQNLIDLIYNKYQFNTNPFFSLDKKIVGESHSIKIEKTANFIKKNKSNYLFISAPENVAWLLNLRGKDNPHSPIPNCRLILKKSGKIYLFAKKSKISNLLLSNNLKKIELIDEGNIDIFLKELGSKRIILDRLSCSLAYENIIRNKINVSNKDDPIYNLKSIKNKIEIKNIIKSHILDCVAIIKFLYWIKKIKKDISELDTVKKLNYFRKKNKDYLFPSFNTIAASGPNGAIIHYRANSSSNRLIRKSDIFLCDSGGQYKYGTTDITRTICLTKQSNNIKNVYSYILKGHIAVANANLKKITSAHLLDKLARKFLKKRGLDYPHGTGHGVGYFLNVHEGPVAISKSYKIMLKPGHVISNEPGFYKKGKFGIRLENMIYVKKLDNKIYFKNLTLVPFDKELINFKLLTKEEKKYLINYNLQIYSTVEKYLTYKEKFWLLSQFWNFIKVFLIKYFDF